MQRRDASSQRYHKSRNQRKKKEKRKKKALTFAKLYPSTAPLFFQGAVFCWPILSSTYHTASFLSYDSEHGTRMEEATVSMQAPIPWYPCGLLGLVATMTSV